MSKFSTAELAGTGIKNTLERPDDESLCPTAHPIPTEKDAKVADFRPRLEPSLAKPVKIAIKTKGKILLINPSDILTVEAEGNYVLLQCQSVSYLMRESISTMAEKLKIYGFVRIHRSVLVNASCVEEIHPGTTGDYMLRIAGGKEYVVSRTYKDNLKCLAHSWIGTDSFADE